MQVQVLPVVLGETMSKQRWRLTLEKEKETEDEEMIKSGLAFIVDEEYSDDFLKKLEEALGALYRHEERKFNKKYNVRGI